MPSSAPHESSASQHEHTTSSSAISTPPWKSLFQFTVKKDIPLLISASIASILAALAGPAQAFITGKVFDGFITFAAGTLSTDGLVDQQRRWLLYLVGIGCGSWLFHSLEMALWMSFGELQAKNSRQELYGSLSGMNIAWFDLCEDGIDVMLPRLASQIKDLQTATSQPLGAVLSLISTTVSSLAQALFNSWDLTLVTLAGSPFIIAVIFYFGIGMQKSIDKQQTSREAALKHSLGALSNIETVKCFNAQDIECKKYSEEVDIGSRWYRKIIQSNATQMAFLTFLVQSMFVQAFYYGGVLIRNGKKKPSEVITTFFSAITAFQALQGIFPQLVVLEKGRFAGLSLREAIPRAESIAKRDRLVKPLLCRGNIQLTAVTFRYPSRLGQLALDNVNLTLAGGALTFLIGKSGSGKSTIGQLLIRFYEIDSGTITLDGEDIVSLDMHWLRSNVTLVEQTSTLFSGSVSDNIALGCEQNASTSREGIQSAIEFALLQNMIVDMPDGANTVLDQSGQSVSGGQRQRIALARARLRDTPILILDESTSALDQINRELMMDAIRQWRQGKTTIIVTHDLTQIRSEDYAVVLETGKVVQQGVRGDMEQSIHSPFTTLATGVAGVAGQRTAREDRHAINYLPREPEMRTRRPTSFFTATTICLDSLPFHGLPLGPMYRFQQASPSPPAISPDSDWDHTKAPKRMLTSDSRTLSRRLQEYMQDAGLRAMESRSRGLRRRLNEKDADLDRSDERIVTTEQPKAFTMLKLMWHDLDISSRTAMIIGYYGGTIHAACSPVFSFVLAKLLSLYSSMDNSSHLSLAYSMAILGIATVDAVHTFLYRVSLERASQAWTDLLRRQASSRLLDQPQEFFESNNNSAATLAETLDHQAEEMRNLFGRFLVMLYIAIVILTIAFLWALSAQWKMTLMAITAGPYIFVVAKIYAHVSEKWERMSHNTSREIDNVFAEAFVKVRTVRSLTLESYFDCKFSAVAKKAISTGRRRACYSGLFYGMSTSAGTFATTLVFYIGTKLVHDGASVGSVIQVFAILILTISNVTSILDYVPQIGSAKEMAQRVLHLATLPESSHERKGDTRIMSIGLIDIRKLDFAYPTRPEAPVLKAVDLQIKSGITTAIVGGSGSGKSTIAKLLLKLYAAEANSGRILLAGRDLARINTKALRQITAVVAQASPLFSTSIKENIVYGLPLESPYQEMQAVVRAAIRAGIHDFIVSLPDAYATIVGPGGVGLSGGQVQRIAIARALVRNPSLLILDEATSALDAESAALVKSTIHELVKSKDHKMTVVMITHNREMMEVADHIVVLDQGCVVEAGSYEDLITRHGHLVNLLQGGAIE